MTEPVTPPVDPAPLVEPPPAAPPVDPKGGIAMTPEIVKLVEDMVTKRTKLNNIKFEEDFHKKQADLKVQAERKALTDKINADEFMKSRFDGFKIDLENKSTEEINTFMQIFGEEKQENTASPKGDPVQTVGGSYDTEGLASQGFEDADKGGK